MFNIFFIIIYQNINIQLTRYLLINKKKFFEDITNNIIGVDEVGRGALCGPVVSCSVLLKKEIYLNLTKKFDDRFSIIGDYDLFLRITYKHKVKYINEPLGKWRIHGGNYTYTKTIMNTQISNSEWD